MAASTTKKAIVRRYDKESLAGYPNPLTFLQPTGVELLSAEGNVATVPYGDIKTIAFVRDFGGAGEPDRRIFNTRPKMEGLWVSLQFRDGDVMEGVMPNNLLQVEHYGFTVIPPIPSATAGESNPAHPCSPWKCSGWSAARSKSGRPKPRPRSRLDSSMSDSKKVVGGIL